MKWHITWQRNKKYKKNGLRSSINTLINVLKKRFKFNSECEIKSYQEIKNILIRSQFEPYCFICNINNKRAANDSINSK